MEQIPHLNKNEQDELLYALATHCRTWLTPSNTSAFATMHAEELISAVYYPGCCKNEYWLTAWGRKVAFEIWKQRGSPK